MTKFVPSIIIFICLTIILFFVSNYGLEKIISNSSKFVFSNNPKYLFIGHSHPTYAYNDSIIDNSINFSSEAESYLYEYSKLKYITSVNKSIKYVFIEVSNIQTIEKSDNWVYMKEYMGLNYPKSSPFMSINEKYDLYKFNKKGFNEVFLMTYQKNILRIVQNKPILTSNYGGYVPSDIEKLDSILKNSNIDSLLLISQKDVNISKINIQYLKKCITYCENNNIKIFLSRAPSHPKAPELANEIAFKKHLSTLPPNVEFLDFNNFILPNDHYRDFTHLNTKGATVYSIWFNNLLKQGLTSRVNKQQFIDSSIKNFNSNNNIYQENMNLQEL
jgi:hypothetical protein